MKSARKPNPPVYVTSYGGLWRVSAAKFAKLREIGEAGGEFNLDDYGTYLGNVVSSHDWEAPGG